MNKGINFYSRDFKSIRSELIEYIKKNYSDFYADFNDASIGMMLLELNAAVSEMLSFNIDRNYQETLIDYAQERRSIMALARTFGLKIPSKSPSITVIDFAVDLPVKGNSFDITYAPIIIRGARVSGSGLSFETTNDIDFSSPYSQRGFPNRTIVPNIDGNGIIKSYTITKREIVLNGVTKYFKKIVTNEDSIKFLEIYLPDNDVLSVDEIISLNGVNFNRLPTLLEWVDDANKWYEVESLAENSIFKPLPAISTDSNIISGKWEKITKKYMTEYTDKGFCIVRFGNGTTDTSYFSDYDSNINQIYDQIDSLINNSGLGEIPKSQTTLFIKYRTGGGVKTNTGANSLTIVENANIIVNGTNSSTNNTVKNSLKVNNPLPALGGRDELNIEEIRNIIKYNFSSQNRAVTPKDYYAIIKKMGGQFGSPYKLIVGKNDNKIEIVICNIDENSKLSNLSSKTLSDNIAEYLANYKMQNDYVFVRNGNIINLGVEVTLYVDKYADKTEILRTAVQEIYSFFESQKEFGVQIHLSGLIEKLNNIGKVFNITDIKLFHKQGEGTYSLNSPSNPYKDSTTKELDTTAYNTLVGNYDEIFEIKIPNKDIKINFIY